MEPVKERQGQRRVTQKRPQRMAVKVDAVAVGLVRFDLERLDDPQSDVAHNEERDQFPARLVRLQRRAVAATAQSVDDERRLQNHLHYLLVIDNSALRISIGFHSTLRVAEGVLKVMNNNYCTTRTVLMSSSCNITVRNE